MIAIEKGRGLSLMPYLNIWSWLEEALKKYLTGVKMSILAQIDRISTDVSTGGGFSGKGNDLSSGYNWWRCRDLNPGHCGYEPHALTD